jgi:hypothetical protein
MSANMPAKGAALAYAESVFGGPTNEIDSVLSVSSTPAIVIHGNGDRVGLVVINLTTGTLNMSLSPQSPSTNGFVFQGIGTGLSMDVTKDFTLPSRDWYLSQAGGSGSVYVIEYLRFALSSVGQ